LRPYTIHERAFAALLVLPHDDIRRLTGLFEWLAENPIAAADGSGFDADGRQVYVSQVRGFRIFYRLLSRECLVSIEDIVPR
jgi:hypothetical protein